MRRSLGVCLGGLYFGSGIVPVICAASAAIILGLVLPAYCNLFVKRQEYNADLFAVKNNAGKGMLDFLKKHKQKESFLEDVVVAIGPTHPRTKYRIAVVERALEYQKKNLF